MLRRIERDRREQTKHRQDDTQRLIQRNKNLLKDIFNRQIQEKRKTKQFLTWALSDIHTFNNVKVSRSSYQPKVFPNRKGKLADVKVNQVQMTPKTHKVKRNPKIYSLKRDNPNVAYKQSGEKNNSLMVLRNKNRNRSYTNIKANTSTITSNATK